MLLFCNTDHLWRVRTEFAYIAEQSSGGRGELGPDIQMTAHSFRCTHHSWALKRTPEQNRKCLILSWSSSLPRQHSDFISSMACDWLSLDPRHCAAADDVPTHGRHFLIVKLKHFLSQVSQISHGAITQSCKRLHQRAASAMTSLVQAEIAAESRCSSRKQMSAFWRKERIETFLYNAAGENTSLQLPQCFFRVVS